MSTKPDLAPGTEQLEKDEEEEQREKEETRRVAEAYLRRVEEIPPETEETLRARDELLRQIKESQPVTDEERRAKEDFLRRMDELERETEELRRGTAEINRRREELRLGTANINRTTEEERRRTDEIMLRLRATTLHEYLRACHDLVLCRLQLSTDEYVAPWDISSDPVKQHCPVLLAPWDGFAATQAAMIKLIDGIFGPDRRLFESLVGLEGIGSRVANQRVGCEPSLRSAQLDVIDHPVRIILQELRKRHPERYNLAIPDYIDLHITRSDLCNPDDTANTLNQEEGLRTDQILVFRDAAQQERIALVVEYKAPHKLPTAHLEQGLRPMNIFDQVVNKPVLPTADSSDRADGLMHYAELLSAAAVVQTYSHMLEAGLEYGYVTNGDAIVFLHIDWTEPTVVRYHLARPMREVAADNDSTWSNAVCQVLAFHVLALQSGHHSNNERTAAANQCRTWEAGFDYILGKVMAEEEERQDREEGIVAAEPAKPKRKLRVPSSPDWQPTPVTRSQRDPRQPMPLPAADAGRVLRSHSGRDVGGGGAGAVSSSGGAASGGIAPWPSRKASSDHIDHSEHREQRTEPRQYCTRRCLLSLINNRALDHRCPNVELHRAGTHAAREATENQENQKHAKKRQTHATRGKRGRSGRSGKSGGAQTAQTQRQRHHISLEQLLDLLREQFRGGLEPGVVVVPRKKEGSCGVLFQITLLAYGYTFVGKGVTGGRMPDLDKEAAVYERLWTLQGYGIPACLGTVDLRPLRQVFFYDVDVRVVRFLLLSHGGPAAWADRAEDQAHIVGTVTSILDEMHSLGVAHGDIRRANVLQDSADGQISIVSFDRAVFLSDAEASTSTSGDNKRRRLVESGAAENPPMTKEQEWLNLITPKHDVACAKSLFTRLQLKDFSIVRVTARSPSP